MIIAIDAGGTKTIANLYKKDGTLVSSYQTGTMHFRQVGLDGMAKVLMECYEALRKEETKEVVVSIGMPGYGHSKHEDKLIMDNVKSALQDIPFCMANDVEIAHAGALGMQDGIVVIAGTGSIAMLKHQKTTKMCGGWGDSIGDEGSAFWLAKKMLQEFSKQSDGRKQKTRLYDLIKQELNLEHDEDIISYVNDTLENKRDQVAKLATIVSLARSENDQEAMRLFDECAKEIASMINTLASNYNGTCKVSYIGGVFRSGPYILEPLQSHVNGNVELCEPLSSAQYGAFLLGLALLKE